MRFLPLAALIFLAAACSSGSDNPRPTDGTVIPLPTVTVTTTTQPITGTVPSVASFAPSVATPPPTTIYTGPSNPPLTNCGPDSDEAHLPPCD